MGNEPDLTGQLVRTQIPLVLVGVSVSGIYSPRPVSLQLTIKPHANYGVDNLAAKGQTLWSEAALALGYKAAHTP
jgi:hypothetical protein